MTILRRIRGLVLFGWAVAMVRFVAEALWHPGRGDPFWFLGVYFLMPIAFLVIGIRGTFDDLRWPKIALIALLLGVLVWGVPNAIIYTVAQFQGWTHGRFTPHERAAPIAPTALGKLGWGLSIAGGTAVAGAIWCLLWTTVLIWLPGVFRRRRARAVPS
jgi:hypothetical protein